MSNRRAFSGMTMERANKLLASPATQQFRELGVPGLVVIPLCQTIVRLHYLADDPQPLRPT